MSKRHDVDSWQLWAKGSDAIQEMRAALQKVVKKGRKCDGERSLLDHIDAMMEMMQAEKMEEQKNEKRALKRVCI